MRINYTSPQQKKIKNMRLHYNLARTSNPTKKKIHRIRPIPSCLQNPGSLDIPAHLITIAMTPCPPNFSHVNKCSRKEPR